jgi:uncharacterized protein with NRDE domain
MCIILLAVAVHPKYSLMIASNRDEFLDRPTESMTIRTQDNANNTSADHLTASEPSDDIPKKRRSRRTTLAGRDLVAGGTWLGLDVSNKDLIATGTSDPYDATTYTSACDNNNNNSLRWIALTNFLEGNPIAVSHKTSRGSLLTEYLGTATTATEPSGADDIPSAEKFASELSQHGDDYNPFSVLMGDKDGIYYCTNGGSYPSHVGPLAPGIYGLSNGLLDSPWPKIIRGKGLLDKLCKRDDLTCTQLHEALMEILCDKWKTSENPKPDYARSSIFVSKFVLEGKDYGTRSSTTILVERLEGRVSVLERTWPMGDDRWFEFVTR